MMYKFLFIIMLVQLVSLPASSKKYKKGKVYNPASQNFCEHTCKDKYIPTITVENSACVCVQAPSCKNVLKSQRNMVNFRRRILLKHNKYREKIASGREVHEYLGQAANMNLLNYDLNLEYQSLCQALMCSTHTSSCATTKYFEFVNQSVSTTLAKNLHKNDIFEHAVTKWYNQIRHIFNDTIDKNEADDDDLPAEVSIASFVTIATASITHIGCAITKNERTDTIKTICSYGSRVNSSAPPVYQRGKPCTKCDSDKTCNHPLFPSLCGYPQEIPTDIVQFRNSCCRNIDVPNYEIVMLFLIIAYLNK